ncbi:excisionase family protein [Enterobacter kobei]|nr:excisionase family protein [Enterobacter kobei]MCR2775491.1 excisionase family protein [Enterobacter kobei]
MSDIIQLVPNKWVSEELLIALTGLTKHAIKSDVAP